MKYKFNPILIKQTTVIHMNAWLENISPSCSNILLVSPSPEVGSIGFIWLLTVIKSGDLSPFSAISLGSSVATSLLGEDAVSKSSGWVDIHSVIADNNFWWYSFWPLMTAGVIVLFNMDDADQSHCVVQYNRVAAVSSLLAPVWLRQVRVRILKLRVS